MKKHRKKKASTDKVIIRNCEFGPTKIDIELDPTTASAMMEFGKKAKCVIGLKDYLVHKDSWYLYNNVLHELLEGAMTLLGHSYVKTMYANNASTRTFVYGHDDFVRAIGMVSEAMAIYWPIIEKEAKQFLKRRR